MPSRSDDPHGGGATLVRRAHSLATREAGAHAARRSGAYEPFPFLAEGMAVEVVRGPLMGVRGKLLRKDRELRVVLSVTLIRQSVSVVIDAEDVAPV